MKNIELIIIGILLATLLPNLAKSQAEEELKIQTSTMQGTKFYVDFKRLSNEQVIDLMAGTPLGLIDLNKGIIHQTNANMFSYVGGLLIGWPIGATIGGGGEFNWKLAAAGAVLTAISIPIYAMAKKSFTSAVTKYNGQLIGYNSRQNIHYSISLVGVQNGGGLRLEF